MESRIARAIDDLADAGSVPPVHAIEDLAGGGALAVRALVELLEGTDMDDDDWSPLWAAVALGELRDPYAVPALLTLLELPEGDVVSEAAVEALAKIGPPALPALAGFVRTARDWEARHYAYAALSLIPSDDSLRCLVEALDADPQLWSAIAMALADLGDRRALPALKSLLARADTREAPVVREAIAILEGRHPPYPNLLHEPWQDKYRGLVAEATG